MTISSVTVKKFDKENQAWKYTNQPQSHLLHQNLAKRAYFQCKNPAIFVCIFHLQQKGRFSSPSF